jgi:hypothetical protein
MKTIFLCLLFSVRLFAQNISNDRLETIVKLIVSNLPELPQYIYPEELEVAKRFGISYQETENKFFIANEFPQTQKNISYDYKLSKLENNYSKLSINILSQNITRDYYLKDSFIVSKPFYFSGNWKVKESNYFKFFISDETLFNDYSIQQLEKFIEKMFYVLDFSDEQKNEIRQKKIYYFLCKDESEIQKVTGFATRGIYILAQDYVVTIYNTHYHELVHFLINFKLKDLPLYTHPFLQEGLAVAFGGRGGLETHTIFETGVFLIKSGFANYNELLNRKDFQNTDATISYPISGLYIDFLIKQIGIEKFVELYKKYSSSKDLKLIDFIDKNDLPSEGKWNLFVDSLVDKNPIKVSDNIDFNTFNLLSKKEDYEIYSNNENYLFRVKDTLLIAFKPEMLNYQSKLFAEYFRNKEYNSEKYLIIANQNEISIYNLYSNNLIGKYVASFSIPPKEIKRRYGFYEFYVYRELFDEKLESLLFVR